MHEPAVPPPGSMVTYCSTSFWRPFRRGVLLGGAIIDPATEDSWLPLFGTDGRVILVSLESLVEADESGVSQRRNWPPDPHRFG